jgi:hypothetical protein
MENYQRNQPVEFSRGVTYSNSQHLRYGWEIFFLPLTFKDE